MDTQLKQWEEDRFAGRAKGYWYTQTKESLTVRIPVNSDAKASDFHVEIEIGTLKVVTRADKKVLCQGSFPGRFRAPGVSKGKPLEVHVDDCFWTYEDDGVIAIELTKDVPDFWHSLFEGEEKIEPENEKKVDAKATLEMLKGKMGKSLKTKDMAEVGKDEDKSIKMGADGDAKKIVQKKKKKKKKKTFGSFFKKKKKRGKSAAKTGAVKKESFIPKRFDEAVGPTKKASIPLKKASGTKDKSLGSAKTVQDAKQKAKPAKKVVRVPTQKDRKRMAPKLSFSDDTGNHMSDADTKIHRRSGEVSIAVTLVALVVAVTIQVLRA